MKLLKIEDNENLSTFLEQGLQQIYEHNATRVAIYATLEDNQILSGYFNCDIPTKLLYAGYVQQDAMIDTLEANGVIETDES